VKKALPVIDLQSDYFPGGKFPLWNTDVVLQNIERAIAKGHIVPVIHIQHVAKRVCTRDPGPRRMPALPSRRG
jgi:nicotinamidase-related amidase